MHWFTSSAGASHDVIRKWKSTLTIHTPKSDVALMSVFLNEIYESFMFMSNHIASSLIILQADVKE